MIDEKFSFYSFEQAGLDTEEAKELAGSLAQEIQQELKLVIKKKLEEIIKKLNEMGHEISLCEEESDNASDYRSDDICYENNSDNASTFNKNLRVYLGLITSVGYAHLETDEDLNHCLAI